MAIPRPSKNDLQRYATTGHFTLPDAELDEFAELVNGLLESIERVEPVEEPRFRLHDVRYPREPGWRPSAEENPYNAWITRCRVEGAADGLLAGKTVGL